LLILYNEIFEKVIDWGIYVMKRSILVLFIFSLFLSACGQGASENQASKSTEQNTTQVEVNDDTNTSDENENNTNKEINENEENENEPSASSENTAGNNDVEVKSETNKTDISDLTVHYIDANQADATLFQYADDDKEYHVLFDAGDWDDNNVITYLSEQDIDFIDLVIISHPHADHIGQLAPIMEQFEVGEVWFSGNTSSSKTFQKTVDAVMASEADYYEPRAGETFDVGPLGIEILHPDSLTGELNEDSISARFTYGNTRFLFTGDAYQNEEQEMLSRDISVTADVLQLGHHGSKTSSHPDFIEAVDPDIAIYSAGEDNSYGHPHEEVVNRIKSADITLYGTDVHGTIIITTDGESYDVSTLKDGNISGQTSKSQSEESEGQTTQSNQQEETSETEAKQNDTNDQQNASSSSDNCIDLNSASIDELQDIIHIGPARAERVIEQRPFKSVEDLTKINGIGAARLADIEEEGKACVTSS